MREYTFYKSSTINVICRFETVDARRKWVIEQLSTLLKRCLVSKNEDCVSKILMWLATNSFFIVSKKSAKSINPAV